MPRLLEDVYLLDEIPETVAKAMANLDREMIPILTELLTLGSEKNGHPAAEQLFNWLVDPERTGEEFCYVIGPLKWHVSQLMSPCMLNGCSCYCQYQYLNKLAAEALAVKCPILEDPWEKAVRILMIEFGVYDINNYGAASDRLSDWIIQAIGNPDLCPNPYLRIELMILLYKIVVLKNHNWAQAIASVLSACSSFDINYLLESSKDYLEHITEALKMVVESGYMFKFDEILAAKLLDVETSRLSSIVYDVAYHCAVNPNRYSQPMELHGLTALLKFMARYMKLGYKNYHNNNITRQSQLLRTIETIRLMHLLINNLKKSLKTTQLVHLTSYVIDVMVLVIPDNAVNPNIKAQNFQERLDNIGQLLLSKRMRSFPRQILTDLFR